MGHGGKRVGAGRPKGSTKKGTEIDDFNLMLRAQEFSSEMLGILVDIARNGSAESTRLVAATQVLNRAHGRPGQIRLPEPVDELDQQLNAVRDFFKGLDCNRDAPLANYKPD